MIATLQSLRFIFVMMIFMSHFAYHDMCAFDVGGDCGVAFFLILSGFVLSLRYGSAIRDGSFQYSRFLKRRFLKLYPLHLLCLVFFLAVARPRLDLSVLLNALLLQSWVPRPDYYFSCNSVSWFLSSLFFCYLLFPFAYRHVSRWWVSLVLVAYLAVLLLTPYEKVNAILYVNPLVRFADFYIGIVLARSQGDKPYARYPIQRACPHVSPKWTEWLMVVLVVVTLVLYPYVDAKFRNAPLFWLVLAPLILVFAKEQGCVSSWLRRKPMLFLSSLSMPLFMTHQMLTGILIRRLPELPTVAMLFVCILVVLVVSWCIDRFFLRQIERMG